MSKNGLHIDILGTDLTISADEAPHYLNALLEKFRLAVENVQRTTGIKDPLKTAVLTGFLLCDDLEKAKTAGNKLSGQSGGEEPAEAEELTLGMISRLDEIVPDKEADTAGFTPAFPAPIDSATASFSVSEPSLAQPAASSAGVFKLQNTVKHYDWGSAEWLPAFLGRKNISRVPWAEYWLGVHPAGPSRAAGGPYGSGHGETGPLLSELIARDPEAFLGREIAGKFGALPFLLKIIAAAKPLSIQAHPSLEQAKEGFERETARGIPLDAPNRNYKDPNHKPEIICALTPFAALCGFRDDGEILALMEILSICSQAYAEEIAQNATRGEAGNGAIAGGAKNGGNNSGEAPALNAGSTESNDGNNTGGELLKTGLDTLIAALKTKDHNPLEAFIAGLYGLEHEILKTLGTFIKSHLSPLKNDFPEYRNEWDLSAYLSGLYPGDPGIIAPLFLNIVELAPGEAMYLPAGIFHAYIRGMGIELMANSDNVLRGGLTAKHIDPEELSRVLDFSAYKPEIMKVPSPLPIWYTYPAPAGDFSLSVMQGSENDIPYPETGPSLLLVTEGKAVLTETGAAHPAYGAGMVLEKGESVFIPAGKNTTAVFSGEFTAYIASVRCESS